MRPLACDFAYLLFATGIISTGLLAVPVLAGASAYAVSKTAGMREGLGKKPRRAPGFYAVIVASTMIGMSLDWFGLNPITVLYYTAALNDLAAPSLMSLIIMIANRKDVMGQFVNSRVSNVLEMGHRVDNGPDWDSTNCQSSNRTMIFPGINSKMLS